MSAVYPSAPLCVSFRLTYAEYRSGIRQLSWRLWAFRAFVLVPVLALVVTIGAGVVGDWPLAAGAGVVAVGYVALLTWMLVIRPDQTFRQQPDLRGEQTYCFSDDDVSWIFVSGASHVKWTYFVEVLETKELFVLRHPLRRVASLVPKRAFTNSDAEVRFRQLVAGRGKTPSSSKP